MKKINEAVEFVKKLFHVYIIERDIEKTICLFDENITWIGTGPHEISRNFMETNILMENKDFSEDDNLKITEQWHQAMCVSEDLYAVFGAMHIEEDIQLNPNFVPLDINTRFSLICKLYPDGFKLLHAHFSLPNENQEPNEFIHKSLVKDYNPLLEQKLEHRTELLRHKTTELETLMSNIQGGIMIRMLDTHNTITYANRGFYNLIGHSAEDIKKKFANSHQAMIVEEDAAKAFDNIHAQLEKNRSFQVEYRMKRASGEIIWVLEKGRVLLNKEKNRHIQCILTDITTQKILQEELHLKTLEMQTIYENVDFGIIKGYLIHQPNIKFINSKALKMLGLDHKHYTTSPYPDIPSYIFYEDLQTVYDNEEYLIKNGGHLLFKIRILLKDTMIWLFCNANTITDQMGRREIIYTLQDITEEEKNKQLLILKNEQLLISEKRYEIAVKNSNMVIFDYIISTKQFIYSNNAMEQFGLPAVIEDAVETIISNGILHPNSIQAFREAYLKIDNGAPYADITITLFDIDNNELLYNIALTNIFDEYNKPIRAIGIRTDITHLNSLEKEKKYQQAMTSDKMMTYEINLSRDLVEFMDHKWANALNIPAGNTFSALMRYVAENLLHSDFVAEFEKFTNIKLMIDRFENGETLLFMDYRRKDQGIYKWIRNTMNIIRDESTDDIKARCYISIINEQKEKELRILEEQRFYEAMIAKSAIVYEVNITKNLFIKGHETWEKLFGIQHTDNYTDMMHAIATCALIPDDVEVFNDAFLLENVLKRFHNGEEHIYCEYRRPDETGEHIWVSCTMHLLEDPNTNELKGFSYIQNIQTEKLRQIELIYRAEHDLLTNLYNKATTEKQINAFLRSSDGKSGKHAFLIIDIDRFKAINDNFGHAFGDDVLVEIASKIRQLFRSDDIVGRIGGDEFVALMKNIQNEKAATIKALEICNILEDNYSHNNLTLSISASVGIDFCCQDENYYDQLYKNSDTALYLAKQNGRNQVIIYQKEDLLKSNEDHA